jgi:uncharacterized membrane protein
MNDEYLSGYHEQRFGVEPLLLTLTGDNEYFGRSSRKKKRAVAGAFLNPFAQFKAIKALRKRRKAKRAAAAQEQDQQPDLPGAVPGTVSTSAPRSQEPGNQEPGNQEPGDQEPGDQEPGDLEPGDQEPEVEQQSGDGVNISTNTVLLLSAAVGLYYLVKTGKLKI